MKQNFAKLNNAFVISIFLVVLFASYIRIYFGVYFTDESFYIALPYRFILGNIPLKDEYSICQFAGILLYPFYYLYLLINHSTDAIVIFSRNLYFVFFAILSGFCYFTFKNILGWQLALLTATYCIAFNFCNIALLSYNTLATFFLTCGCLCNYQIYQQSASNRFFYIAAGCCFSAATFVYPPLIICGLVSFIILSLQDWRRCTLYFTLGAMPILLLSVALIYHAGIPSLINTYQYLSDTGYTSRLSSSIYVLCDLWSIYTSAKGILLCLLTIYLISYILHDTLKRFIYINQKIILFLEKILIYSALLMPAILIMAYLHQLVHRYEHMSSWDFVTDCYTLLINLCLLAPFYIKVINNKPLIKNLLITIWVPSLIAGLTTGFFSKNGLANIMVGLFPALIVASIIFVLAYKELSRRLIYKDQEMSIAKLFPYVMIVILIIVLLINKYTFNYQDPPISQLTQNIKQGPFKYIFTSIAEKEINDQYYQDISQTRAFYKPTSILIYPGFSAGYLYSDLLPATNSAWLFDLTNKVTNTTINYLKNRNIHPDIVIMMKNDITNTNDALVNFVNHSNYSLIISRDNYLIYIKQKT